MMAILRENISLTLKRRKRVLVEGPDVERLPDIFPEPIVLSDIFKRDEHSARSNMATSAAVTTAAMATTAASLLPRSWLRRDGNSARDSDFRHNDDGDNGGSARFFRNNREIARKIYRIPDNLTSDEFKSAQDSRGSQ